MIEKRYGDAVQIVHKIKSSSGSIGAKPLYNVAMALQKALNEQKEGEIPLLQEKFSRFLSKLLEEIKELQS
jgi:two-component system sensor histidine kinase/response regulator